MPRRMNWILLIVTGLLGSISALGQDFAPSWVEDLKSGNLGLTGTYEETLPAGISLQMHRAQPGRTDFRQYYNGIPIFGSRVSEISDDLGSRTFVWTYPQHLFEASESVSLVPTVSEAEALDAAERRTEWDEPLFAELVILPLKRAPKLIWLVRAGSFAEPVPGLAFFVDARNSNIGLELYDDWQPSPGSQATPSPEKYDRDQPPHPVSNPLAFRSSPSISASKEQVHRDACTSPPWSSHVARGDGHVGSRCFPALSWWEGIDFIRRWTLDTDGVTTPRVRVYEHPDGTPQPIAPPETWVPVTEPVDGSVSLGDFGADHRSAVDAHASLAVLSEYWRTNPLGSNSRFPPAEGVRALVNLDPEYRLPGDRANVEREAFYHRRFMMFFASKSNHLRLDLPAAASFEVWAHEYAHAIAPHPEMAPPSPATEAFADLLAEISASEILNRPIDWVFANDVGGSAFIRDLSDPLRQRSGRDFDIEPRSEMNSIHQRSTMIGLAFYLLAEGKAHPSSHGHRHPGPTVAKQDLETVKRLILALARDTQVVGGDLHHVRKNAIALAQNASGFNSPSLASAVRDAFRAVGVVDVQQIAVPEMPGLISESDWSLPADERQYAAIAAAPPDSGEYGLTVFFDGGSTADFTVGVLSDDLPWGSTHSRAFGRSENGHIKFGLHGPMIGSQTHYFEIANQAATTPLRVETEWVAVDELPLGDTRDVEPLAAGETRIFRIQLPEQRNKSGSPPLVVRSRGDGDGALTVKLWQGDVLGAKLLLSVDGEGLDNDLTYNTPEAGTYWVEIEATSDTADFAVLSILGAPQPPIASRPGCPRETCNGYYLDPTAEASLRIITAPPMPDQPIFIWRTKDGVVERDGVALHFVDEQGHVQEARTDANGVYEWLDVEIDDPSLCATYRDEAFAVGSPYFDRSTRRSYGIFCAGKTAPGGPLAKRNDDHFPHYRLGDTASIVIETDPPVAGAQIYSWRTKDGQIERQGEPLSISQAWGPATPVVTDENGRVAYSALLDDAAACGTYTAEQFSVGSPHAPRSGHLAYTVYCPEIGTPVATRPDGRFPSYRLGDVAALRIITDPPQPRQRVYAWRNKNGSAERSGELLRHPVTGEPIWTDDSGVLEILDVQLSGDAACGQYTGEQFAVGNRFGPRSASLGFEITCPLPPKAPNVSRTDGNFPHYQIYDSASLTITTHPPQPFRYIYGWRVKDGVVERDGELIYYTDDAGDWVPMVTDANGVFRRQDVVLDDPGVCGTYTGEQFAVGSADGPRSPQASYVVSCPGGSGG